MQSLCKQFGCGLTGNIATGKSTIAQIIRDQGFLVIDADELARTIVGPGTVGLNQIVKAFGEDILRTTGELNREKLGAFVFADPAKRKTLDQISHPLIERALEQELRQKGLFAAPKPWFYEASLLIERGRHAEFREIWLTVCSPETQLKRLMARSNLSESEARQRMASQMPAEKKRSLAQVIIDTDCSLGALKTKITELLQLRGLTT